MSFWLLLAIWFGDYHRQSTIHKTIMEMWYQVLYQIDEPGMIEWSVEKCFMPSILIINIVIIWRIEWNRKGFDGICSRPVFSCKDFENTTFGIGYEVWSMFVWNVFYLYRFWINQDNFIKLSCFEWRIWKMLTIWKKSSFDKLIEFEKRLRFAVFSIGNRIAYWFSEIFWWIDRRCLSRRFDWGLSIG